MKSFSKGTFTYVEVLVMKIQSAHFVSNGTLYIADFIFLNWNSKSSLNGTAHTCDSPSNMPSCLCGVLSSTSSGIDAQYHRRMFGYTSFNMSYAQVSSMTSMRFVSKSRYCVLTKIRIFFMSLFIAQAKFQSISNQCSSTIR